MVGGGESGGAVKELPPAPGGSSVAMGKATVRNGVSAGSVTWASQMAVWGASRADGVVTKGRKSTAQCCFPSLVLGKGDEKAGPGSGRLIQRQESLPPSLCDSCLVPPCEPRLGCFGTGGQPSQTQVVFE